MKPTLKRIERDFLQSVCKKIEDPVVNARICYLFEWYTRKAQHNKRWYNWSRFITYLIPCLITLISVYASIIKGDSKWAIIVVATLSAMLVGLHHVIDHFRFYENWVRYRGTAEKLKREAELFLNRCEPYSKTGTENRKAFAAKIERITKAEIANWENLQDESYKPFKEENQAALQTGGNATGAVTSAPSVNASILSLEGSEEPDTLLSETACEPQDNPGEPAAFVTLPEEQTPLAQPTDPA